MRAKADIVRLQKSSGLSRDNQVVVNSYQWQEISNEKGNLKNAGEIMRSLTAGRLVGSPCQQIFVQVYVGRDTNERD